MEQCVMNSIEQSLNNNDPLSSQTLASIRSLVINPATSDSTLSSLLHALTRSLQLNRDPVFLHHILKLLVDLSSHRPHLSPIALDVLRSNSLFSSDSPRLVGESLSALVLLTSSPNEIDAARFVSLCLAPSISVRLWLLRNAGKFAIRDSVLLAVFIGFTRDPYPHVRKAAMDGLVKLCKNGDLDDRDVTEGCYFRAVGLLRDAEDCVRSTAVRGVCECGKMLVISSQEEKKQELADAVFIQLCSIVRDMSMKVRLEAFDALGKIGLVSEDILLQTLSKKVLGTNKEKIFRPAEGLQISASAAAGAFIHGLEDEFSEVRMSACYSLRMLIVFSLRFAAEALNLLMDMLNDDSMDIRLQALETMHDLATTNSLKVEEIHMHRIDVVIYPSLLPDLQFLGTLFDSNSVVRSASRKILKLAKLAQLELFKLCIDGLLGNLETYPQDEVDVFSVLFHIGRNHGKFTVCLIEEVSSEMEPAFGGKLGFDSTRVAAFLVLAISAPLSFESDFCGVPPRIFSYAVTWLEKISCALSDVMSQDTLLAYLFECSRSSTISLANLKMKEALPAGKGDVPSHLCSEAASPVRMPSYRKGGDTSDHCHQIFRNLGNSATHTECELAKHDDLRTSINLIFRKVKDLWPLVQLGCINETLKAIRTLKEEVALFSTETPGSAGTIAFTLQYLRVTKLLVAVWEHLMPTKRQKFHGLGEIELLLAKLDRRLREITNRFIGLSKAEELQIFDLIVLACLFRLSKVEICCYGTAMKKLSSTMSHLEFLLEEGSNQPSHFIVEVKKSLHGVGSSAGGNTCEPFVFKKLLSSFSLQKFVLCTSPRTPCFYTTCHHFA
ncbi:Armadillo-like helical [Corchorus olitorius]|uniref:Armadillo-like helical n=1 Tax=Corchorus olitorius TaxID=93759 RepID=A0A1R3JS51_9ROSI|nr:Armadillo-like helical [Corchorus olitorius]